jgi:hypothetical protein
MATPSKMHFNPLRSRQWFNPVAQPHPFNPMDRPQPFSPLRGARDPEPVIVPGEPVMLRFRNQT